MPTTRLTRLEAVNQVLAAISQAPQASLSGNTSKWAQVAINLLDEVDRRVQLEGWDFNLEYEYTISANISGEVEVPTSCTAFDVDYEPWVVLKGNRLYDKKEKTFVLNEAKTGTIKFQVDFDDLPDVAKQHMVALAAYELYEQFMQQRAPQALVQKVLTTRALLQEQETLQADYNMADAYDFPFFYGSEWVPSTPKKSRY